VLPRAEVVARPDGADSLGAGVEGTGEDKGPSQFGLTPDKRLRGQVVLRGGERLVTAARGLRLRT
jgi:hypothetical protein